MQAAICIQHTSFRCLSRKNEYKRGIIQKRKLEEKRARNGDCRLATPCHIVRAAPITLEFLLHHFRLASAFEGHVSEANSQVSRP